MKILKHGWTHMRSHNICECYDCLCQFSYEDNEIIHTLSYPNMVWSEIICPECGTAHTIYNYKGNIDKVRIYKNLFGEDYNEVDFDENTMERR